MIGKVLKVKQNNLEFGVNDRYVNILGVFKYKKNGNLYVLYTDIDTKYSIVYYGAAHLSTDYVLCMKCRDKVTEEEYIKEYIFKTLEGVYLDDFEMFNLDNINTIEIIASDQLEVKAEVLTNLKNLLFPKKEEVVEEKEKKPKKKSILPVLLMILIIAISLVGGYYYLFANIDEDTTEKSITCTKEYPHNELEADMKEENKYNFDNYDKLKSINTTLVYQFNSASYQDFILKGTYYKYMPEDIDGGFSKDDDKYTFTTITKEVIDTSYNKPTNYEEVLSYNKNYQTLLYFQYKCFS